MQITALDAAFAGYQAALTRMHGAANGLAGLGAGPASAGSGSVAPPERDLAGAVVDLERGRRGAEISLRVIAADQRQHEGVLDVLA